MQNEKENYPIHNAYRLNSKNKQFIIKKHLILLIYILLLTIFTFNLFSCYQYKFNSIVKVKIDKRFEENSNINVIFGDGFLIRNGYNQGMKGIYSELKNCNLSSITIKYQFLKYKFLNYKSEDKFPLNERKIDLNLMIDNFEDNYEENSEAELIAYSEHRNDLLFRIQFNMIRSIAPLYKTFYYHDPGIETGSNLGKEICKLIQENDKKIKK
ncbi:hypothetical protein [Leptospira paudalimensis]|uniref:Lipoprotein n=1 Tax=Leptospira paudalimensis TaxID=2950024 RepID=A0ABT3M592_9LEPT|nr:hypothetical protein [Leptospira paudalimensis]MCW7503561.1 hypothetical protein [Leptospira paudalimensis]